MRCVACYGARLPNTPWKMPPAARVSDLHECPMSDPAPVPVPHVGLTIIGPGVPNVLIGGLPASVVGDNVACVGPPDVVVAGSSTVLVGGRPAARLGDSTAHGGQIILGMLNVLIGG